MQVVTRYPDGVFSWVDLGTTDTKAAKVFYSGLFGWSFLDIPTDSGPVYSMAQLEDKNVAGLGPLDGAMFGVWQPADHIGAQLVNIPNTLIWNELQTPDAEKARAFYSAVFGWTYDIDESDYVSCKSDDRSQSGMMQIQESWGDVPPNWSVYFMVEDAEAAVAKVQDLGGNVIVPVTPAGELGRFAVVQDPQGAIFSVMHFTGPVSPPPGY
jgi:predicted enzyme related to lactoylglutathione lyase